MKQEIIEALKQNEKPFGLMTEELKHAMACDFEKADMEYFNGPKWLGKDKDGSFGGYAHEKTYRLRPDYEPESEIVEKIEVGYYVVTYDKDGDLYFRRKDGDCFNKNCTGIYINSSSVPELIEKLPKLKK